MKPRKPRGEQAARLRQRKFALLQRYQIPETVVADLLPGSLSQSRRRCGKPTCHCATGPGHPSWYLAFMVGGTQRVEHIPAAWAAAVRRRATAGRGVQQGVAEGPAAHAPLPLLEGPPRRPWRAPARGRAGRTASGRLRLGGAFAA